MHFVVLSACGFTSSRVDWLLGWLVVTQPFQGCGNFSETSNMLQNLCQRSKMEEKLKKVVEEAVI